jgi:hypothetical protein
MSHRRPKGRRPGHIRSTSRHPKTRRHEFPSCPSRFAHRERINRAFSKHRSRLRFRKMRTTIYWLRWIALVPAFFLAWRVVPILPILAAGLLHYDTQVHFARIFFLCVILESFATPLICTAIAPEGRLLVGMITAFLNAMPGIFALAMAFYMHHWMVQQGEWDSFQSKSFETILGAGWAFVLGAGLALLLIYIIVGVRRPKQSDRGVAGVS